MSLKIGPIYTVSELENRFEKVRVLGGGGEGCVYEVKERSTGDVRALKIASNNWRITPENIKIANIISSILQLGESPHLTQIHELLSVEYRVFAKLGGDEVKSFFDEECLRDKRVFPRRAYLMERLQSNLKRLSEKEKGLSKKVEMAFLLQLKSIELILESRGICAHESGKERNILYKTVGPEDQFQGKAMIDFDFWKYSFGSFDFYLPQPEYLFKLADYDPWQFKIGGFHRDPEESLKSMIYSNNIDLKDLQSWFNKPEDPHAKILEVYDSSTDV